MQHKDYVKAAKELNKAAGLAIKVVAVKGDVLKKSIQDAVKNLTNFDFSTLSAAALDVFDDLKCEMAEHNSSEGNFSKKVKESLSELDESDTKSKKDNVIPIKKETPKERTVFQQGPAMINAATDLVDVLNYGAEVLAKFKNMSLISMTKELQNMANEINRPYDDDKGNFVNPDDKPSDFKPDTIKVFDDNDITVNWSEVKKPVKEKKKTIKKDKPTPKKKEVKLQFHEYANLFPDMLEDDFNEIVKDMNESGFRTDRPIILFGGKIADGKNRYKAASIAGVDATYTNFEGTKEELFKHVIALNLKRRHLTPAQRAALAADLLPEFEKAGKKKQSEAGKGKKAEKAYRATEEAAKATGSTSAAVSTAKKIKKKDEKTFQEMKQGKKTIAQAKRKTETKTNEDKFIDAEKMLKAKLKIVRKSIHDFIDAAELAEQDIKYQDNLDLIENAILTILG